MPVESQENCNSSEKGAGDYLSPNQAFKGLTYHGAAFQPSNSPGPIDNQTIFRELIAGEVRAGRMNRAQRRRIVRYAAQLGLSAVEAGELISECQMAALARDDFEPPRLAQLPIKETGGARSGIARATLVAAALIIELLLLGWIL